MLHKVWHCDIYFECEFRRFYDNLLRLKGVQAQTIANFFTAFEAGIQIIPVINKIDLKTAKVELTIKQLNSVLDIKREEILFISAKSGLNCDNVLKEITNRIPW